VNSRDLVAKLSYAIKVGIVAHLGTSLSIQK
jgi:hypothetical protein